MKRTFVSLILAFVAVFTTFAQQTVVQNKDLDSFSSVSIDKKFSFRLKTAPSYSVRIISDERIADYIYPTVKNGVFTITLDEKKYPSELKKALKAKGAVEPFLEIEISAPNIKNLELKGKSVLLDADDVNVSDFTLKVGGSARVDRLKVNCISADLTLGGSSQTNVSINAGTKLNVLSENSAGANIMQKGGNVVIKSKGSSAINFNVNVVDVDVEASAGSSTHLSGQASMLYVKASGGSLIDAEALEVKEGNFIQSGSSKCHVNVEESIRVNLTGGCMLTFKRKPSIEVERIVNSTLIKADDPYRK